MAVAILLYYLLHLLPSPTTTGSGSRSLAARKMYLLVHPVELQVLPWAVPVGFVIYTVLICVLSRAYVSVTMKQNLMKLSAFSLLVSICQLTFFVFSHTLDASFTQRKNAIALSCMHFDLYLTWPSDSRH